MASVGPGETDGRAGPEPARGLGAARLWPWFLAVLAVWVVAPAFFRADVAQDAVPYLTAGDLVRSHPDEVYGARSGDLFDLSPTFAARACALSPPGTDCAATSVAFVSPPPALPLAYLVALLGRDAGAFAFRLVAGLSLAAGMIALWRRLAPRDRWAPLTLVVTALLLTPFALLAVHLGQTTPLLFLAASIGVARTEGGGRSARTALTGALWAITVALKVFPLLLLGVVVRQRRWRLLAWAAGVGLVLGALALLLAPASLAGDAVTVSRRVLSWSLGYPYNGSVEALVHRARPAFDGTGVAGAAVAAFTVCVAIAAWWWAARRADADTQWAYGWLVALLVVPAVWWHYLWLAVPALALGVAALPRPGRALLVLPVWAAVTVVVTVPYDRGAPWPVVQAVALLAVVAVAGMVVRAGSTAGDGVANENGL